MHTLLLATIILKNLKRHMSSTTRNFSVCNDDGFHSNISDFAMCMQTTFTQLGKDEDQ